MNDSNRYCVERIIKAKKLSLVLRPSDVLHETLKNMGRPGYKAKKILLAYKVCISAGNESTIE